MQKQYSMNNMKGHIGNIKLEPYKHKYKSGFIVSSGNDEVAVYKEFGTGIVGYENPNPLASDAGYEYNIGTKKGHIPKGAIEEYGLEYCKKHTTSDTWWYHKNNKWWYTKGMAGSNMYSSLVDKLRENAVKGFKASVSQTIGNYGGK